ncbi:MAG: amino acid adenylation domain-containing protein [Pseudomonadota bacterium]
MSLRASSAMERGARGVREENHTAGASSRGEPAMSVLTPQERHQILYEWNATATVGVGQGCILGAFGARVAERPQAIALVSAQGSMSFGELDRRSNQLAQLLVQEGTAGDDIVAIFLERSFDMVIAILAVLKAGGAYLCLDPAYPRTRLEHIWNDARPRLLVTTQGLLTQAPFVSGTVVRLDTDSDRIQQQPGVAPATRVGPGDLAYVIYTSGSTGRPKGILLEHRGLANLIEASNRMFDVDENTVLLQLASPSFDVSVWEIFMALAAGARLVLPRLDPRLIALELPQLLRQQGITMALIPPSLLAVMPSRDLVQLRTVIAVGERVTTENVRRWAPGRRFFNCYGPAEATVTVSGHLTHEDACYGTQGPPIGRPLANLQLYVLDPELHPVPVGVEGELCVGGVGLARGYLNRPELTAQKFVPHPFDATPGARLYRSGDLARFLADGNIEFLGRLDQQVKLRGQRIELGEIESVLCEHPDVADAVALLQVGPDQLPRLVAFIVPRTGQAPRPAVLREHLLSTLPLYMVPATVLVLDEFPRSPNGKVDRAALAAL